MPESVQRGGKDYRATDEDLLDIGADADDVAAAVKGVQHQHSQGAAGNGSFAAEEAGAANHDGGNHIQLGATEFGGYGGHERGSHHDPGKPRRRPGDGVADDLVPLDADAAQA